MATKMTLGGASISIYEQDGAWSVDDWYGTQIAQGMSESKALQVAHRWLRDQPDERIATEEAIDSQMTKAGEAGDEIQVALCLVALGDEDDDRVQAQRAALEARGVIPEHVDAGVRARAICAQVIRDAA